VLSNGGPIDKKRALDKILSGQPIGSVELQKLKQQFERTINRTKLIFPNLSQTRFRGIADFYTLFLFVRDLENRNIVLIDSNRNREAQEFIIALSNGVDEVRERIRKGQGTKPEHQLFKDYLATVQSNTDSVNVRKERARILEHVLEGVFAQKDTRRLFTEEQRRLIWHSTKPQTCCICSKELSWDRFQVDHFEPHSRGGRTSLENAKLICPSCNSRKGNAEPKKTRSRNKL
jgi:5-methylcytosine-specific restriction endonuclease McrA